MLYVECWMFDMADKIRKKYKFDYYCFFYINNHLSIGMESTAV